MKINANAVQVLAEIAKKRNWHEGKLTWTKAAHIKRRAATGELSYESAKAVLLMLGWEIAEPETWVLPAEDERLKKAAKRSGAENISRATAAIKAVYEEELKRPMDKRLKIAKSRKG